MNNSPLKKLLMPAILLLIFVIAGFTGEDVLRQFGWAALAQARNIVSYTFQIGLWLSAAFFLNRCICVIFWDTLVSKAIKGQIPRLLKDITFFIVYAIAGTGIMSVVFNKPVTGFWATSGVIGIVLGFALKSIILDLFTGLAVNVDRPYSIGDWIMIVDNPGSKENLIGCVQEINWRTTRLKTTDNNMLVVPNSVMGQKVITNFMTPGEQSRFELDFTLDFSVPSDRAIRVLTAAVKAVADEKEGPLSTPEPKVRVTGISELGVKYRLRYWVIPRLVSPAKARNTVIKSVLEHMMQAGITLAYPKQDTYLAEMPSREYKTDVLEDRVEILSRIPWMKAFNKNELKDMASLLTQQKIEKYTIISKENYSGESMFIVIEGLAEILTGTEEIVVGKILPGGFFDDMCVLTGEERKTTTRAITDMIVYEITKDMMASFVEKRPEVAENIAEIIAEKRVKANKNITEYECQSSQEIEKIKILDKIRNFFSSIFTFEKEKFCRA